jgi:translation elongation factor EF-G
MPLDMLHATYGTELLIRGQMLGEPVMEVRIGLERRYLPEVRNALWRRKANASEEYDGPHYCVLRFEAPVSDLLGLPVELADLTSGRLSHQIVLTRYR